MTTTDELADRTQRAVRATVAAGADLGLQIEQPSVLHDVFSVVVHLAPEPVVARIPVVLTGDRAPERQSERQQRELDVVAWLDGQGVPVVPPAPGMPRSPVQRDGFSMTFWELAHLADDHEPYRGVAIAFSARLHAGLIDYPGALPFLSPFNHGLPDMLAELDGALDEIPVLGPEDIERAHAEYAELRSVLRDRAAFEAAFPSVRVQPIQGDAPSHNVIRTVDGIRFADFEDVCLGPVEWDLALLGPQAVAEYDAAAAELGLPATDPEAQRVLDAARRLQFVGCVTLIPQLPVLADGLAEALEDWRGTAQFHLR